MINLKIDPEFQSQIPPLTDDEFKQLEENILKECKLISPLIVPSWQSRARKSKFQFLSGARARIVSALHLWLVAR